ncbi:MAG: DNA replication/repair protein RecF [Patescibacteria group bacterium]|jgi:DNA replication and repair protein RecF
MAPLTLTLTGFRCFDSYEAHLPAVTILVGPNGTGKTSVLEAVHYLALGRSYRTSADRDLLQWGASTTRVVGVIGEELQLERAFELRGETLVKQVKYNGQLLSGVASLGKIHVVLFAPELVDLITGPPRERRRYLDAVLSGLDHTYAPTLVRYRHALKQRNALCAQRGAQEGALYDVWEAQLVHEGRSLIAKRAAFVAFLMELIGDAYGRIAGERTRSIGLRYQSAVKDLDRYEELLVASRSRDALLGATSVGPHRDDLTIQIDDRPAATASSRGEQRSLLLALKAAELAFVDARTDDQPVILLLDDMFSELDEARSQALGSLVKGHQTVITATDVATIPASLRDGAAELRTAV